MNDNTLGAPTEGLGQTVTFAGSSGKGIPQASAAHRGGERNSPQGGNASNSGNASVALAQRTPDAVGDTTFQVLARLGGDLLKPRLEAERQLSYAAGMQKAAQNQAITEIVDEQPWYSKLFGSTSLVDGARAWSSMARATAMATDIETKMPELRKLSANEISKHMAGAMASAASTGDPTTDAMISQQMTQIIPGVMKTQAKEHLRYLGERLEEATTSGLTAQMTRLGLTATKARSSESIVDEMDAFEEEQRLVKLFQKSSEMDTKLHNKLIVQSIDSQLSNGNFEPYLALERSNKLDELSPDERYSLRRSMQQASTVAKGKMSPELFVKAVEFRTMSDQPGVTWEAQIKVRDEVNAEYTRTTGDPAKLIDNAMTATEMLQRRTKEAAEAKRQEADAIRINAPNVKFDAARSATQSSLGRAMAGDYMTNLSPSEAQAVFGEASLSGMSAATLNTLRSRQSEAGIIDDNFKEQLRIGANHAIALNDPIALAKVYNEQYLPLVNSAGDRGERVAQQYVGAELGPRMARYHAAARGTPVQAEQVGLAYSYAVLEPSTAPSTKHGDAIAEELTKGFWRKTTMAVGNMVSDKAEYAVNDPKGLASIIEKDVSQTSSNLGTAIDVAVGHRRDLTVLGGHWWLKSTRATNLDTYLAKLKQDQLGAITPNETSKATRQHISALSDKFGIAGDVKVGQQDDVGGVPRLFIMGHNSNNEVVLVNFTGADIATAYKTKRAVNKAAVNKPMWAGTDPIAEAKFK